MQVAEDGTPNWVELELFMSVPAKAFALVLSSVDTHVSSSSVFSHNQATPSSDLDVHPSFHVVCRTFIAAHGLEL